MRRAGFALLFVLGFLAAGGMSAAVVAETLPTTGSTSTDTGTTATGTTGTDTTGTTTTSPQPQLLPSGVRIAGVEVGGLDPESAVSLVQDSFQEPLDIRVARRRLAPSAAQLGAAAYVRGAVARARAARPGTAVQLVVTVRGERVRAYARGLAKRFDRVPRDARLTLRGLSPRVTPEVPGRRLDRAAAVRLIVAALRRNERGPLRLRLAALEPSVTRTSFSSVIVIHRGSNRLFLYRNTKLFRTFGVATGQQVYPTPLGRFQIVVKWENPWWYPPSSSWAEGLDPVPPGPGNPLGTRWMGLSAPGIGIHGTPDSASIGYSASHGCIRMLVPQAEWLFEHVQLGTPVFIVSA